MTRDPSWGSGGDGLSSSASSLMVLKVGSVAARHAEAERDGDGRRLARRSGAAGSSSGPACSPRSALLRRLWDAGLPQGAPVALDGPDAELEATPTARCSCGSRASISRSSTSSTWSSPTPCPMRTARCPHPGRRACRRGHPAMTEVRVELEPADNGAKVTVTHIGIRAGSPGAGGWATTLEKSAYTRRQSVAPIPLGSVPLTLRRTVTIMGDAETDEVRTRACRRGRLRRGPSGHP